MSLAIIYSHAILGVEAVRVTVETHLSNGLPAFAIVGLPETAVKESKERVRSALINSGFEFPSRRITVNLAPADLPKAGGRYDLAIALSVLLASGQLDRDRIRKLEVLGELALDGSLRPVHGAVPAILAAEKESHQIVLPMANSEEAALVGYQQAVCTNSLLEYVEHLAKNTQLPVARSCIPRNTNAATDPAIHPIEVRGQLQAKRAVQIAAAGGHNLLMIGPPGSGKTLLANSLINLLPLMTRPEALEVAAINSVSQHKAELSSWQQRPIRTPHHSATCAALVGGGSKVAPGEISLAHRGVLFLDELTEFKPGVLDALREPLESGEITVSRANYRVTFPASFQLVAAMNPCPCGYASDPQTECRCSQDRIARYLGKLSGPLLDRLDLIIEVPRMSHAELLEDKPEATDWSAARGCIADCRQLQLQRNGKLNSELSSAELERFCQLGRATRKQLAVTMEKLSLSARATHRVIKMARTIADFDHSPDIGNRHLMEAVGYRKCQPIKSLVR